MEIAAELGLDPRMVRKTSRAGESGAAPRRIGHPATEVDAWLTADLSLRASVIYERLVAEHSSPCTRR